MLHRKDGDGVIVIGQTAHAWVSGQLARAWGNDLFGDFAPREEVCLAAELHDMAWSYWESEPALNPRTGLPYSYTEMLVESHLAIWATAGKLMLSYGRYPALLVSLHGSGLYERRDYGKDSPEDVQRARAFLESQWSFQEQLLALLRADAFYGPYTAPEVIARNRQLVLTWDRMSLALCGGLTTQRVIPGIPTASSETALSLTPVNGNPTMVTVTPWPFHQTAATLVCEGRRLAGPFTDREAMRAALAAAPWVTIKTHLRS